MSLSELLERSLGAPGGPRAGAVHFGALHALLHAVLRQLNIREVRTRWRDAPPGAPGLHPPGASEVKQPQPDGGSSAAEQEVQPGSEAPERAASPASLPPATGPAAEGLSRLRSRIQTCEDDLSKAVKLLQELQDQKDGLKEEIEELRQQQEADTLSAVDSCRRRVDVLQEAVRSLRDSFHKYPDPQELEEVVTWDSLQSALCGAPGGCQEALVKSGVGDPSTHTPGQTLTPQEVLQAPSDPSWSPHAAAGPRARSASERYPRAAAALRDVGELKEKIDKLEARVAALEEGKVDQSQLTQLRELITNKGSQDAANNLMDQLKQQRAMIDSLRGEREKSEQLQDGLQTTMLQLQTECEKLQESSRCLHEDLRQKQSHIEDLYKTTEELEEKKADKQMVESEIKADKSALESKVSRLQFDSVTEQLNAMFHELLTKVTGQEQDWHKVIHRLSTEMECKMNRIELDSVKKQLEGRWKNIHEKLQAQGAPEHEDAAALRKQLVDRFHCLSCDRPVVKYTTAAHPVKLPSSPGFPAHKSIRPFTVYALEQFRQHCRSERISELADYSHLVVSRSCGGSHTVTSAGQRRSGLQTGKHHGPPEDSLTQSEEVDIVGLDGHIYRGRLNAPAIRPTETKLPTISTKEGVCKTKDRARCSPSHKAATTPEAGPHHPPSAKSAPCSRSASSSSGRDWPVSALGCTSQSSLAPAERDAEPPADEPLHL